GALITMYRSRGWLLSHLDPLSPAPTYHPMLDLRRFGLSDQDLDKTFHAAEIIQKAPTRLREILDSLKDTYCSSIGVQYAHMQDVDEREWLQQKMESVHNHETLPPEE